MVGPDHQRPAIALDRRAIVAAPIEQAGEGRVALGLVGPGGDHAAQQHLGLIDPAGLEVEQAAQIEGGGVGGVFGQHLAVEAFGRLVATGLVRLQRRGQNLGRVRHGETPGTGAYSAAGPVRPCPNRPGQSAANAPPGQAATKCDNKGRLSRGA